jgi:hypothetical protein
VQNSVKLCQTLSNSVKLQFCFLAFGRPYQMWLPEGGILSNFCQTGGKKKDTRAGGLRGVQRGGDARKKMRFDKS